jgi:hypothetical protein
MPWATIKGSDLKVGDVMKVWWQTHRDTITELRPYRGPLQSLWPEGAQIAIFAYLTTGMTIDNSDDYEVQRSGL